VLLLDGQCRCFNKTTEGGRIVLIHYMTRVGGGKKQYIKKKKRKERAEAKNDDPPNPSFSYDNAVVQILCPVSLPPPPLLRMYKLILCCGRGLLQRRMWDVFLHLDRYGIIARRRLVSADNRGFVFWRRFAVSRRSAVPVARR
jgi:hypothetical protein